MLLIIYLISIFWGCQSCMDDQYRCNNGRCISKGWLCDGEGDCTSWEDESNCEDDPVTIKVIGTSINPNLRDELICSPDQFACIESNECISLNWHCDGENDCSFHEDESNCPDATFTVPYEILEYTETSLFAVTEDYSSRVDHFTSSYCDGFRCYNGSCILKEKICDGVNDCGDLWDEMNCTVPSSERKNLGNSNCDGFLCSNERCITRNQICNNVNDCGDNSDEEGCQFPFVAFCNDTYCNDKGFCLRNNYNIQFCKCSKDYSGKYCEILIPHHEHRAIYWIIFAKVLTLIALITGLIIFCCYIKKKFHRLKYDFRQKQNITAVKFNNYEV